MRSRPTAALAVGSLLAVALLAPPAAAAPSTVAAPSSALTASAPTALPSSSLGALTAVPGALVATRSKPAVTSKKRKHKRIERRIIKLVNMERRKAGLSKVKRRAKIVRVARAWSVSQARQGRLAHNPSYARQIPSGWSRASENVAWTTAKGSAKKLAKRIVKAWLRSSGHRANILDPHMTKTGVGVARSKRHGWYLTQNFSN